MKIKREDTVLVTTGEYKGDQGQGARASIMRQARSLSKA